MSVWIVRELAEIEGLVEQAENRALALSMRLISTREGIETSARASVKVPVHTAEHTEKLTASGGDAAEVAELLGPIRDRLARAVKRAADVIPEPER